MSLTLVTGFPGFIGRLVRHLLAKDPESRIIALVEERMLDVARSVISGIDARRIEPLVGDIASRRLGLDEGDYERLRQELRHVFHLAAIYNLSVPREVAQRVNVEGTGNVLELCLAAKRLERLAYVSTILRPAIVVGDSRTGETEKFDGPYYILRAISRAHAIGRSLPQFGRANAAFNVVPVDYVVAAMAAAAADPNSVGETLHLVDPDPLRARELVSLLSQEYAGRAPKGRVSPVLVTASLRVRRVREIFGGTPAESIAYRTTQWSTTPAGRSICSRRTVCVRRTFGNTVARWFASSSSTSTTLNLHRGSVFDRRKGSTSDRA